MATRLRDCSDAVAAGRLRKAEQFLEQAAAIRDLADDEDEVGDSVVSLCVLAGIVASDVLCCRALGHFVQGVDHQLAVSELSKVRQPKARLAQSGQPRRGRPLALGRTPALTAPGRAPWWKGIRRTPDEPSCSWREGSVESPIADLSPARAAGPSPCGPRPRRGSRSRRRARSRPRGVGGRSRRRL